MADKKIVTVKYFAALREQAGRSSEELETQSQTAEELYDELAQKYSLSLPKTEVKVAINDNFEEFSRTLHRGDTVIFIPPIAGG